MLTVGVLALQGGFRMHRELIESLGRAAAEVKTPSQLDAVDALVIPGGESSAITKLMKSSGLGDSLAKRIDDGMPVFGTCAGMILCAREVVDGIEGQAGFGNFSATVRRNGLGNQQQSRQAPIDVNEIEGEFEAVFIRPPIVLETDDDVEILASWHDRPILCRQGQSLFASFHPELTSDGRIHELFLERL